MTTQQDISTHYTHGNLIAAIRSGIESLGKTVNSVTVDDLAPVDEFHTGGRQASEHFLGQLDLTPEKHILDVGCGLGGPARFAASRYQCRVDGIDLTPEYIETGRVLCGATSGASCFDGQKRAGQDPKYDPEHFPRPHRTRRVDRSESLMAVHSTSMGAFFRRPY
jgi:SAM-dependent methyltransferase